MKNSPKSSLAPLALACFGLASVMGLAACGGGGGEQTATNTAPPAALADPRETSVIPSNTMRWKGVGSERIGLAGITQSSDGGVWALGAEDGLTGRPFLRKIGGANPCGADGQRFLSEIYTRFERRQGPVSMTTVQSGRFYAAFMGPGTLFVTRFDEGTCAVDPSFGAQGVLSIPLTGLVTVTHMALERDRSDGVLVAAAIPGQVLLRRFTGNGVWDGQFGTNGLATNPNGDGFSISSMAVTPTGDILISGSAALTVAYQPALMKLNSKGLPVTAFGAAGVQRYPGLNLGTGNTGTVMVDGDRVIVSVASGSSVASQDYVSNDSEVAAIDLQTGQLRTEFGVGGYMTWDWGYSNTEATAQWMPNGRGGYIGCGHVMRSLFQGQSLSLVDITASGKPDTSVGYQGRRLIADTNDATCAGLLRMSDGRLAVAARDGGEAVVMFFDR